MNRQNNNTMTEHEKLTKELAQNLFILSEKMDRYEKHREELRKDVQVLQSGQKEIILLLGGSAMNGNKGFLKLVELTEEKVDKLQKDVDQINHDLASAKWWGKGITGVAMVIITVIIGKLFESK